eukprot:TRINITY_DN3850_c0_g1_i1.p1 TRINITY_DN3850_c0_g1~~TRINITY_DN3850_c0_g1_i1.p1  ORF type:complete len:345 (+),score=29.60 TRINITY_DN3850_c0_g1_i1:678-1712(+)
MHATARGGAVATFADRRTRVLEGEFAPEEQTLEPGARSYSMVTAKLVKDLKLPSSRLLEPWLQSSDDDTMLDSGPLVARPDEVDDPPVDNPAQLVPAKPLDPRSALHLLATQYDESPAERMRNIQRAGANAEQLRSAKVTIKREKNRAKYDEFYDITPVYQNAIKLLDNDDEQSLRTAAIILIRINTLMRSYDLGETLPHHRQRRLQEGVPHHGSDAAGHVQVHEEGTNAAATDEADLQTGELDAAGKRAHLQTGARAHEEKRHRHGQVQGAQPQGRYGDNDARPGRPNARRASAGRLGIRSQLQLPLCADAPARGLRCRHLHQHHPAFGDRGGRAAAAGAGTS